MFAYKIFFAVALPALATSSPPLINNFQMNIATSFLSVASIFISASLTLPAAYAESVRPIDPSAFDIAGVKLGMSLDEAIDAATKTIGVNKKDVKRTALIPNSVTSKIEVTRFQILTNTSNLIVVLVPRVPKNDARPTVVSNIIYAMPGTVENRAAMRQAAKEKYGQPSTGTATSIWEWCESPGRYLGEQCTSLEGAKMKLQEDSLSIQDDKYKNAYIEFEQALKSGKPKF